MQPLRSVLHAFAERPGVTGVVVVSDEGLVVESALPDGRDAEAIAAIASTAIRGLSALGNAAGLGPMTHLAADTDAGALVLQRLPSGATLLVIVAPDADLGTLLFDVRRHAPALVALT
ncbi:MAG TPA: roadblock/LC7 domain-containing protein [Gemmatimonadales bacterium]|jgi:predicted regulator of Ras-like GTPase activity (Roadblock/LC7/MglB family)|nr:roadblock/LC7 domain-containing protein [Gemmatimonadales bacterium]